MSSATDQLRAYVDYLRDLGIYDIYRTSAPLPDAELALLMDEFAPEAKSVPPVPAKGPASFPRPVQAVPQGRSAPPASLSSSPIASPASLDLTLSADQPPARPKFLEVPIPRPASFDALKVLPDIRVAASDKAAALAAIQAIIGDCTRCPLAYAGRRHIVFADGDPNARLMFIGEGPGADEDASGIPFVGKAGHLLNNMIAAMGLTRDRVYIANIVKCRPPANRTPEPIEANTCSPFLLEQIDVVQPEVIVALGATAATYLLGVKQSLASLRGGWHSCRGAKVCVTYHPAYLLRDPSQKGEAWKDLQRVMAELGLKPPARPAAS